MSPAAGKTGNSSAQRIYWVLCIPGAFLPLSSFLPWFGAHGLDVPLFFGELASTRVGMFFGWDVTVSVVVLLSFCWLERARKVALVWTVPIATLTVGVSLGLPLYLALRERSARSAG